MAIISSHILDSVAGWHAGGMEVTLFRIEISGSRTELFSTQSDPGGRFTEEVALESSQPETEYELAFNIGQYLSTRTTPASKQQVLKKMVVRFCMQDPESRYHIPLTIAPASCSVILVVQKQ